MNGGGDLMMGDPSGSIGKGKSFQHPTYAHLIHDAITTLKQRGGSSAMAIRKNIEQKMGPVLGPNYKKIVGSTLSKLSKSGKLIKTGNSFKLGPEFKQQLRRHRRHRKHKVHRKHRRRRRKGRKRRQKRRRSHRGRRRRRKIRKRRSHKGRRKHKRRRRKISKSRGKGKGKRRLRATEARAARSPSKRLVEEPNNKGLTGEARKSSGKV